MTATRVRRHVRAALWAGLAGSLAVHAAVVALAAAIQAGVLQTDPETDFPARRFTVTLAARPAEIEPVTLVVACVERHAVPPVLVGREVIEAPEMAIAAPPPDLDLSPDGPSPASRVSRDDESRYGRPSLRDAVSRRPGRGATPAAAASATQGVGAGSGGGSAGTGTGGGGPGTADGSATAGLGRGAGSDGSGSGWTATGGATRGPSITGRLSPPAYPANARSRGWEGRVVLDLTIDECGRVTSVEVVETSGRPALDDAARDAAPNWTFAPALRDGSPVAGTLRVPVRFALTD